MRPHALPADDSPAQDDYDPYRTAVTCRGSVRLARDGLKGALRRGHQADIAHFRAELARLRAICSDSIDNCFASVSWHHDKIEQNQSAAALYEMIASEVEDAQRLGPDVVEAFARVSQDMHGYPAGREEAAE